MPQMCSTFTDNINSVSNLFSFSPEEYRKALDIDSSVLISGGREIIHQHKEALHTADGRSLLDQLLYGLLEEAPTLKGQHHVGAVLHLAQRGGEQGVINAAKVWLERLVFPMIGLPKSESDGYTRRPEIDEDFRTDLALRERCCCAITKYLDYEYVEARVALGKPIPDQRPQISIRPAYIIPLAMSPFSIKDPKDQQEKDVILNWNLLLAWSGIDISGILEKNINSPANGIFLAINETLCFDDGAIIFDNEPYPLEKNKYMARVVEGAVGNFSDGRKSAEVEFLEGKYEVPNPLLLAIRASLSKAIYWNGSPALRSKAFNPGFRDTLPWEIMDIEI